jgi:hypothetical protein
VTPPDKALLVACPICNAKPGEKCASLTEASKYFDIAHAGRRALAQKGSE